MSSGRYVQYCHAVSSGVVLRVTLTREGLGTHTAFVWAGVAFLVVIRLEDRA